MKSKSLIEKQLKRKTNSILVETIIAAKKAKGWNEVASLVASPRRNHKEINLSDINKINGKIVVIPGKVLSQGELEKKVKIVAISFSESAKEKIKKAGSEFNTILEEIKSNPEAKGVEILK